MSHASPDSPAQTDAFRLEDDGRIPNHPAWPLLVYEGAIRDPSAPAWEEVFERNSWSGAWRNGIFSYHHYHSTSHEVLGVAAGAARVAFGGAEGVELGISAGDVAILPAGTGHCLQEASGDLLVVGAYPRGQEGYDLCTGEPSERPGVLERIARTARPGRDPVYGAEGPLLEHWPEQGGAAQSSSK